MREPLTLYRAAQLRELAALGFRVGRSADLLSISHQRCRQIARQFGIRFPGPDQSFRNAVRDGYARCVPTAEIARLTGSTVASVKVTASLMGITRPADTGWGKRGFAVPEEKRSLYREARQNGATAREAGMALHLIERPPVTRSFPRSEAALHAATMLRPQRRAGQGSPASS